MWGGGWWGAFTWAGQAFGLFENANFPVESPDSNVLDICIVNC